MPSKKKHQKSSIAYLQNQEWRWWDGQKFQQKPNHAKVFANSEDAEEALKTMLKTLHGVPEDAVVVPAPK